MSPSPRTTPTQPEIFDAVVAGRGPVGLAAALALAHLGLRVAAFGQPAPPRVDPRAIALMAPSVRMLERLGVWQHCRSAAQPMTGLRLIDATGRLLRAPETLFRADDIDLPSFGACVAHGDLQAALLAVAASDTRIRLIETAGLRAIHSGHREIVVTLAEGQILRAPALVGADGRNSPVRTAAGIAVKAWSYPQTALALTFRHSRPHDGISIEFHRPSGPLTTVPLPGNCSSLVWVEAPREAERLVTLDHAALAGELRRALHGVLGAVTIEAPPVAFPLGGMTAEPLAQRRTALVGEAAHVMPPIGAQGLNLGLRDVGCLADALGEARARGADLGDADTLARYAAGRRSDLAVRTTAVDWLNRSLLSAQLPAQALRGFGLHALGLFAPLRRALMREGLAPSGQLPALMREIDARP